jgi:hypothetical protein
MPQSPWWGMMYQASWLLLEDVAAEPGTDVACAAAFDKYFDRFENVVCKTCRERCAWEVHMRLSDTYHKHMSDRTQSKYLTRTLDQIQERCTCAAQ